MVLHGLSFFKQLAATMSAYTAGNRDNSGIPGIPSSPKSSSLNVQSSRLKLHLTSDRTECENDDPLLRSARKIRDINSTYVISACKKTGDVPQAPNAGERLALQRRVTRGKESSLLGSELGDSAGNTMDMRLTLQRRAKTDSVEKRKTAQAGGGEKWKTTQKVGRVAEADRAWLESSTDITTVNKNENSCVASVAPLAEDPKGIEMMADEKHKATFLAPTGANENVVLKYLSNRAPTGSQGQTEVVPSGHLATRPLQSKVNIKVPGSLPHRSIGKDTTKSSNKFESLEKRRTPTKYIAGHRLTPKCGTPQPLSQAVPPLLRRRMPSLQATPKRKSSLPANERERSRENTLPLEEEAAGRNPSTETDPLKVENSQVTVAVRVRPFSKRYATPFNI